MGELSLFFLAYDLRRVPRVLAFRTFVTSSNTLDAKANQSCNDPIFRLRNYQNVFENIDIYFRRDSITPAYCNRRCAYTTLALNIVATMFH